MTDDDSNSSDDSRAAADRQTSVSEQRKQGRLRNRQTRAALAVLIDSRQTEDESSSDYITDDSRSSDSDRKNMASRSVATAYAEYMISIRMVTTNTRAQ